MTDQKELRTLATEIRKELVLSHNKFKLPHIGSELSCVDIMVALYFSEMKKNDKFILSKGHAGPLLYAILHRKGVLSDEAFASFGKDGTMLTEHPAYGVAGVEAATGSLGHGLSIGVGMALANKIDKSRAKTFVLLSDGELEEGSTMEAMNSAARFKLDNLVAIVDSNRWQAYDRTDEIQSVKNSREEFAGAGWHVIEIDGHDYKELLAAFEEASGTKGKPTFIVANTVLGKGVRSFEDMLSSHYKPPTDEHVKEGIV